MSSGKTGVPGFKTIIGEMAESLPMPGDTLNWQGSCVFNLASILRVINGQWPGVVNHKRDTRQLLDSATGHVLPNSEMVLIEALRPLFKDLLPVYLVSIRGIRVVLKLYCKEERKSSSGVELRDIDFLNDHPVLGDAKREAQAYERLEKAQGSIIPYCYGFYEFTLGNGARCLGQVLEYIEGGRIAHYAKELNNDSEQAKHALLRAIYTILIELQKLGVIHRDAADRNMFIIEALDPLRPSLVIFDFNHTETLDMSQPSNVDQHPAWLDNSKDQMVWFKGELGPGFVNCKWEETVEGAIIVEQWEKDPRSLTAEERRPLWAKQISPSKL